MKDPVRPLLGFRVLDLTNVLSGPMCTQQLALLGAEVIKVENPDGGDLSRRLGVDPELSARNMGVSFLGQNAGKRSIAIDLKHPEGKALFQRLSDQCDVLVENFRPGVMTRLGLDYAQLKSTNERLIYCSISGFGQTGPLSHLPAYDQIVQGMSGIMAITGDEESAPLRVGYPVADTIGGLTAALAITASLASQDEAGNRKGCLIDVSMLESTLSTMGWVISNWLMAGLRPAPLGNQNVTASPSGTFQTGDGLINIAANQQAQFVTLCEVLGRPELAEDSRFVDRYQRLEHRETLSELLEQALAADSADAWRSKLVAAGVPAGCVHTTAEIFAHDQIRQRRLVTDFGERSPASLAGPGFLVDGQRPTTDRPPPALAADSESVLRDFGLTEAEIAALTTEGIVRGSGA